MLTNSTVIALIRMNEHICEFMKFIVFFLYESRTFGKFYLATCATGCTSIDITPWTNVWSIEGPQGSYWQQATVPLPDGTTYVHFKGYAEWEDGRLYGGMAIDDVALVLAFIRIRQRLSHRPRPFQRGRPRRRCLLDPYRRAAILTIAGKMTGCVPSPTPSPTRTVVRLLRPASSSRGFLALHRRSVRAQAKITLREMVSTW